MQSGWELIEQRADGRWYTVNRTYGGREVYTQYARWLDMNVRYHRNVRLREVQEGDAYLSASLYPDGREENVPTQVQLDPHEDGFIFGRALAQVFVLQPTPELSAQFSVAARFATTRYEHDGPAYASFIQGFAEGIQAAAKSKTLTALNTPTVES